MKEEWRDIGIIDGVDYTGLYQISNYGQMRSLDRYEKFGKYERFRKGRIKEPHINKYGYVVISLCKDGKQTPPKKVSRLEAIAFNLPIPEHLKNVPIENLEIDHIDTNKLNNRLDNYRWTDRKGNLNNPLTRKHISEANKGRKMSPRSEEWKRKMSEMLKGRKISEEWKRKIGERNKNNSKISKVVLQIDRYTNEIINEFPSTMEVQRQLDYAYTHISACCLGKRKTAYGYKWSYK